MNLTEAIALERQGRLDEAEAICRRVVTAERTYLQALHLLGTILYRKGDFDQAIGVIQQAIELSPRSVSWLTEQMGLNVIVAIGFAGI